MVHKSAIRVIGAACGTSVATALSGLLPPGDATSIVLIFVVIAFAVWLRPINYAFWAFSVTAALAFLYGIWRKRCRSARDPARGDPTRGCHRGRRAWLILPVRSSDVQPQHEKPRPAGFDGCVSGRPQRYGSEAEIRLQSRIDHEWCRWIRFLEHCGLATLRVVSGRVAETSWPRKRCTVARTVCETWHRWSDQTPTYSKLPASLRASNHSRPPSRLSVGRSATRPSIWIQVHPVPKQPPSKPRTRRQRRQQMR